MRIPTYGQYMQTVSTMSTEFQRLSILFQQANSGNKLLHSSDDPVLASQIKSKRAFITTLESYEVNGTLAQTRSSLIDTSIQNVINISSNNVQALLKNAESGTLTDANRATLAKELEGHLANLINLANTKDANGKYVFSGTNVDSPAYVQVNGVFEYQGSTDTTDIQIGPDVLTRYNESGQKVFGDIYQGNGRFMIIAGSSNTGSGVATPGAVTNPSAYVADDYTITFVTNSSGELAYQIVGASSGQVIPVPPATTPADAPKFTSGMDITFNGMTFNMGGNPAAGDTLEVKPSTKENIFNTIQNVINLLKEPRPSTGNFMQTLTQADASFSQVLSHLATYQSEAGTRTAAIKSQNDINKSVWVSQQAAIQNMEKADPAEVYSALSQQSIIMQTTQAAYMKMQDVLMQILKMQF